MSNVIRPLDQVPLTDSWVQLTHVPLRQIPENPTLSNQFQAELTRAGLIEQLSYVMQVVVDQQFAQKVSPSRIATLVSNITSDSNSEFEYQRAFVSRRYVRCVLHFIQKELSEMGTLSLDAQEKRLKELREFIATLIEEWQTPEVQGELNGFVTCLQESQTLIGQMSAAAIQSSTIPVAQQLQDLGKSIFEAMHGPQFLLEQSQKNQRDIRQCLAENVTLTKYLQTSVDILNGTKTVSNDYGQDKQALLFLSIIGTLTQKKELINSSALAVSGIDLMKLVNGISASAKDELSIFGNLSEIADAIEDVSHVQQNAKENAGFSKLTEGHLKAVRNLGKTLHSWFCSQEGHLDKELIPLIRAQIYAIRYLDGKYVAYQKPPVWPISDIESSVMNMHAKAKNTINASLPREFKEACAEFNQNKSSQTLAMLPAESFWKIAEQLNQGIEKHAIAPHMNGTHCKDYTAAAGSKMLKAFDDNVLLGYLFSCVENVTQVRFAKGPRPEALSHPGLVVQLLEMYRVLGENCKKFDDDSFVKPIRNMIAHGLDFLEFLNSIQGQKEIFDHLLKKYEVQIATLQEHLKNGVEEQHKTIKAQHNERIRSEYKKALQKLEELKKGNKDEVEKFYDDQQANLTKARNAQLQKLGDLFLDICGSQDVLLTKMSLVEVQGVLTAVSNENSSYEYNPIPLTTQNLAITVPDRILLAAQYGLIKMKRDYSVIGMTTNALTFSVKTYSKNADDPITAPFVSVRVQTIIGKWATVHTGPIKKVLLRQKHNGATIVADSWNKPEVTSVQEVENKTFEARITTGLLALRKSVVTKLLDTNNVSFMRTVQELDFTTNLLKRLCRLSGFPEATQKKLDSLATKQSVISCLKHYKAHGDSKTKLLDLFKPFQTNLKEIAASLQQPFETNGPTLSSPPAAVQVSFQMLQLGRNVIKSTIMRKFNELIAQRARKLKEDEAKTRAVPPKITHSPAPTETNKAASASDTDSTSLPNQLLEYISSFSIVKIFTGSPTPRPSDLTIRATVIPNSANSIPILESTAPAPTNAAPALPKPAELALKIEDHHPAVGTEPKKHSPRSSDPSTPPTTKKRIKLARSSSAITDPRITEAERKVRQREKEVKDYWAAVSHGEAYSQDRCGRLSGLLHLARSELVEVKRKVQNQHHEQPSFGKLERKPTKAIANSASDAEQIK